jgi:3-hydroxyisobutyrate dehydrogenase
MRVGFIGLGDQGAPMARRIARGGHDCVVWARREATLEPFRAEPVEIVGSAAEVGKRVDLLETCVFDAAGTHEVLFGVNGAPRELRPGATIAVHSTVSPAEIRELAGRAAGLGLHLLDAPVSGGNVVAARGELVTMIGGDADVLERARPVLATFARAIIRVGDVGAAQQAKLINNAIYTAQLALALDGFEIGAALGLDRAGLAEVLRNGSSRCVGNEVAASLRSHEDMARSLARPTLAKDVRLLASVLAGESALAREGVRPTLLEMAEGLLRHWDELVLTTMTSTD